MNGGLFPLPDGRTLAARRVVGVSGRSATTGQNVIYAPVVSTYSLAAGLSQFSLAMTAGVRTRIYSAVGRGAARIMLVSVGPAGTPVDYRIEAFVDGNRIYDRSINNGSAETQSQAVVGFVTTPTSGASNNLFPDYLPFDASFEVYVTVTQASQTAYWCYLVENHQ